MPAKTKRSTLSRKSDPPHIKKTALLFMVATAAVQTMGEEVVDAMREIERTKGPAKRK